MADDRRRHLGEQHRVIGRVALALGGVGGVVHPGGDDLARSRHGRQQLERVERQGLGLIGRPERRLEHLQ